ncbi:helix-turn-helix transcriptional regulator [Nocardia uniformis]|uniref:Helix-turn-helix transcriptional regulator n=1 Tax=Nocardia uniformis TaxID=53432 RepID=A0A849C1K6_9NOCA|nr:helix-turn-helix transcriptional regulator [Nocardia uniformis]NNH72494.1 helix-turn-helix transcriptional regulator [Nocardia uniformis]
MAIRQSEWGIIPLNLLHPTPQGLSAMNSYDNAAIRSAIGGRILFHRSEKKVEQADLAVAVGVTPRQMRRYETGEQEPKASTLYAIADYLEISVAKLYKPAPKGPRLDGRWYTSNFSFKDGVRRVDTTELEISQDEDLLLLDAGRAQGDNAIQAGDYAFTGELRLHRGTNSLIGFYESSDEGVTTAGSYFFKLHVQGTHAVGYWCGDDYDGPCVHSWATLARTEEHAVQLLSSVEAHTDAQGNLTTWPKISSPSP